MTKGLPHLPRRWWSIDLPGYRDHPDAYATYSAFAYDMLPPIGRELDEDLAWLRGEPVVHGSLGERADGDPDPTREATAEQLDLQKTAERLLSQGHSARLSARPSRG